MPHAEIALHPIHGPSGPTVLPVGHPMWRAGDERLPDDWPDEFVAEMVKGGYAAKPNSKAAKAIQAERDEVAPQIAAAGGHLVVQTEVRG